jgi:trehalose synthase-fused probable maltokinase
MTAKELLAAYAAGERNFSEANLSGANLEGADGAARDPAFAAWLVNIMLDGATLADHNGVFRGHPTTPRARAANMSAARVYLLGGDTTNTLLRIEHEGKTAVVKLLRQCRPGIQPEVEVGTFFACHARWNATPRFLGWLEYTSANGESTAVATIHDFTPDCITAWDHLAALMARGGLAGPNRAEILDVVRALGRTTAEMHQALASRPEIEAFTPVTAEAAARQAAADRMLAHATEVFGLAAARLPTLPAAAALGQVLANRDQFAASILQLASIGEWGALIRIHGDYHLGQVLLHPPQKTVTVIDFEGEPGRALADRRRKTTALKDIAGMCRSFDYLLRYSARIGSATYRPDHLCLLEETYLDAYRTVARGSAWWPTNRATAEALLSIYKLDKVLYELAYELQNRPDWVEVPLAALIARIRWSRPSWSNDSLSRP